MNQPAPPVTGETLKWWRSAVRAYRMARRRGRAHDDAVLHAGTVLVITVRELSRPEAAELAEAAVNWMLEHHRGWLEH